MNRLDNTTYRKLPRGILLLAALWLAAGAVPAQNNRYKIAYNVYEDPEKDNYDIYIMNMDGSGQKNITNTPGVEWVYYAWKDRIFFVSDRDTCHRCYFLYEMDADGNNVRKISDLQLEDSWMSSRKDGAEMIVTGRVGNKTRYQLFLVNTRNGSFKQLTDDTVSTKRDPLFLPGGEEIVLAYRPDKNLRRTVPDELWKMKPDGTAGTQLTFFPKSDTLTAWYEYHAGPPQWNNRYRFISYLSRQKGQHQVYAITPDGKKQWQITSGEMGSGWHAWSPDGNWLVMDKTTPDEKSFDIYLMHYKTRKITRLTDDKKYEQAPVFVEVKK